MWHIWHVWAVCDLLFRRVVHRADPLLPTLQHIFTPHRVKQSLSNYWRQMDCIPN